MAARPVQHSSGRLALVPLLAVLTLLNSSLAPCTAAPSGNSLYFATSLFTASPMDPYSKILAPSSSPVFNYLRSKLTCGLCQTGVGFVQFLVSWNSTHEDIVKAAVDACVKFKIESESVCHGIVPAFAVSTSDLSR